MRLLTTLLIAGVAAVAFAPTAAASPCWGCDVPVLPYTMAWFHCGNAGYVFCETAYLACYHLNYVEYVQDEKDPDVNPSNPLSYGPGCHEYEWDYEPSGYTLYNAVTWDVAVTQQAAMQQADEIVADLTG